MLSATGRSRRELSAMALARRSPSDTEPTQSPLATTGSCETLYVDMRLIAWRTVAVGGTVTSSGGPESFCSSKVPADTRSTSII